MSRTRTAPRRSPSRAPEAKRARRIVRDYLRLATFLNTPGIDADDRAAFSVAFDRVNAALATLPAFSVEAND